MGKSKLIETKKKPKNKNPKPKTTAEGFSVLEICESPSFSRSYQSYHFFPLKKCSIHSWSQNRTYPNFCLVLQTYLRSLLALIHYREFPRGKLTSCFSSTSRNNSSIFRDLYSVSDNE